MDDIKKMLEEQGKLVNELRSTVESKKADSVESKDKIEKITARLAELEEKNQEVVKNMKEKESKEEELKKEIKGLEASMARVGSNKTEDTLKAKSILEKFYKKGDRGVSIEEVKYLRTDVDSAGGYLLRPDVSNMIIKPIIEISPVRAIASTVQTASGSVEHILESSLPTAYRVGQGGTTTSSQGAYGQVTIQAHPLTAAVPISIQQLNNAAFNMESEINDAVVRLFAYTEGVEFVSGTGINQMEGITANTTLVANYYPSTVANDITADSIIKLSGELKTGYNPMYIFNRKTAALMKCLKTGSTGYLWQNGLSAAAPSTVSGYPYMIVPSMADVDTSTYPIAFGDFKMGYKVADDIRLYVVRDEYSSAKSGIVEFVFTKGVGGKVIDTSAIKLYKCSAS